MAEGAGLRSPRLTRRLFTAGVLCSGWLPLAAFAKARRYQVGCYVGPVKSASSIAVDYGYTESSGNPDYDRAVKAALAKVAAVMDHPIRPRLAFMKEFNAHFNPEDDVLAFGKKLLDSLAGPDFDLKVTCVAAHEIAHVLQGDDGYFDLALDDETVRRSELTADAFAGSCLGFIVNGGRRIDRGILENKRASVQAAFDVMFSLGDNNFKDPNHHGTSEERRDAVDSGYTFSNEIANGVTASGDIAKDMMDEARSIAVK